MKNITTHSFTFLITLLCITFLSITSQAQNTSPVYVVEFIKTQGGIMDEGKIPKNQRTDYDDNPVCEIKVKAQGFDEATLQKLIFVPRNIMIMHKAYENGEYRLYVSSRKPGSILIKYQGEYEFKLPYNLEPKTIYELTLGMETATLNIITTPDNAAIYIDGERAGTGYASKAVSIGAEHRYKVECDDYITEESAVTFTQSEKKELNIELRPDFGYITVKSTPSGAEVYIDEKKAGATPYQMKKIKRGQHVVELRMAGYEPFADMVTIKAGEVNRQFEDVTLEAVKVATGTIVLESNPAGAVITIDGRQYGQTPKTLTEFPVGTYTVYFTKEGYQNLAQNLDLKDGGRETLSVTMSKTSAPQQPVPTGTAGAGGGSAAGGAQIASSINVLSFELVRNGIMDEGKLVDENGKPDKKKLYDVNNNPVCLVKVKAQGFDESILEKLIITPMGAVRITHKLFVNGEWKLYVSSKVSGSIKINHQGNNCIYKLPYPLEAKKIYEMTLGMEPVVPQQQVPQQPVPQQPVAAGAGGTAAAGNKTFTVNGVSFEMVAVKGGTFTMGATSEQGSDVYDDEKLTHSVTLSDYYIGKFEVTQELWEAVMGSNPSHFKGSNLPVEKVSWVDCQTFIRKLNSLTGANFRLPTEAEWEYAARGGNRSRGYKYSGSNSINDVAWYTSTTNDSGTKPVGTKSPNELGIYDMSGNVLEWCQDWYGNYSSGSQTNPQGPSSGSILVLRGGGWYSYARSCRVSCRGSNMPDGRNDNRGFRLVLVP